MLSGPTQTAPTANGPAAGRKSSAPAPVLAHRIIVQPDVRFAASTNADVITDVLRKTLAPTV